MKDWKLYQSLHGRGLDQKKLATLAGTGRSHLCQVLANKSGRGHLTRRRLFPHLTTEEVRLLGWEEEYRRWAKKNGSTENIVPSGTKNGGQARRLRYRESGVAA